MRYSARLYAPLLASFPNLRQVSTDVKRLAVVFLLIIACAAAGLGFWHSEENSDEAHPLHQSMEDRDNNRQALSLLANGAQKRDPANPDARMAGNRSPELMQEPSPFELLRDGDFSDLISEHWPMAKKGAADSQLIVHAIMSYCVKYRKRFEGKHLAEVQGEFASFNDPDLFVLNAQVWGRCEKIYESWDRFHGWKGMLEAAANNRQPVAMVWKGGTLISNPETFDDGIHWLESALASGDPSAVVMMGNVYSLAHVDRSLEAAWALAACKLGFDCVFPAAACGEYFTACGIVEPVRDVIVRELGDAGYYMAQQHAERIYEAIASGNIESLNIATDLRK